MVVENYIEKVCSKEIDQIKEKTISDLIAYMHSCESSTIYITKNGEPVYVFTNTDIFEIFMHTNFELIILKYIEDNPKEIKYVLSHSNILDAYYYMRKYKFKHLPVVDENKKLIGEISFRLISSKLADIVIKDPLTGVYNQKYLDVLLEEYNEMEKPLGIIFIEILNLNIIESFYGIEVVNDIYKLFAMNLKQSLRDIDFVFRNKNIFKILTFNDLEVTDKIIKRLKSKLDNIEFNGNKISYKVAFSHVPELENNVLSAIDFCEKKLIEWN